MNRDSQIRMTNDEIRRNDQARMKTSLRACSRIRVPVARATGLCRPATRRTERERQFEPIGTAFSQRCSRKFRSAGRRPGRAGRPRHLFSKQALSRVGRVWLVMVVVTLGMQCAHAAESDWKAGLANVTITPEQPVPMSGYASRTRPYERVEQDI